MNMLALNTAFNTVAVSLMKQNELAANYYAVCKKRGEQLIFQVLENLLNNAQMALPQIDCYVVVQGPGSYTGIRIGMAVAKTLAQIHQTPMIGINSLQLLAALATPLHAPFYVLLNCTRSEVFYAQFQFESQKPVPLTDIRLTTLEALWDSLHDQPVVLQRLAPAKGTSSPLFEQLSLHPLQYPIADAYALLQLGRDAYDHYQGHFPIVHPIYLKKDVVGSEKA